MNAVHAVRFDDDTLIAAFHTADIDNTDSPTESDLCKIRDLMFVSGSTELVNLHYLRNRIVTLRKGGRLRKESD